MANQIVERALKEIEEHQLAIVQLREQIAKLQSECMHDRVSVLTDRDLYVKCPKCEKLI